ncbi:hypothetical protein VSS87_21655, partial [Escherichia coli]|uniref:hypothetical protein n=1 Tax=Escherichia coli TaxID=562 RepID=UPI002DD423F8
SLIGAFEKPPAMPEDIYFTSPRWTGIHAASGKKTARTITSFFLNTFYRKLSSLLKPITPTTPAKYL